MGFDIGPLELIMVLVIALIVLGPQRLPDVAKSVGRGLREFRTAMESHDDEDDEPAQVGPAVAAPAPPRAKPTAEDGS
jgi:sec-independent protein translocase protein TatA